MVCIKRRAISAFPFAQFELAPEADTKDEHATRAAKNRVKIIQDDDEETEWNENQLEDGEDGDGSSYEVGSC